jgi:hypothetical protein
MLPTTKTTIKKDFLTTRVCLVGNAKVGKSTFASQLGDSVIFAATEDGHNFLEVFKVDIKSWQDFSKMVTDLTTTKHNFKTVCVDVIDKLIDFAEAEICARNKVQFIKDIGFGAGYTATKRLLLGELQKITDNKLGLTIITHAKEREFKQEATSFTAMATSMGRSYEESVLGMMDLILYCYVNSAGKRMARTKPNKYVIACGDRSNKLPEVMELDAKKVIEIING